MSYDKILIINGAIIGLTSALAGIPYAASIIRKKNDPDAEKRWKLVHSAEVWAPFYFLL